MTSEIIKPRVLISDKLGRDVFSNSTRKKIKNGRTPTGVFKDKKSPTELSVHRLAPVRGQAPPADRPDLTSDEVIAKISERRLNKLNLENKIEPDRKFYGWAELSVKDARKSNRAVRPTPNEDNKWHADIVLPGDAKTEAGIKRHVEDLAGSAVWRSRPVKA